MTSYHVRHDFTPLAARQALMLLSSIGATNEASLIEEARARDLELGRRQSIAKVLSSLKDIGLVARSVPGRGDLILTELGHQFAEVALRQELLFSELIHQAYWWLWSAERGGPAFSWAYQTVARSLWNEAPTRIDSSRLVSLVLLAAEQQFSERGISFSNSSVLGILHWLRALRPPCIIDGKFTRRISCTPEALIISIEGVYAATGRPLGVPLKLDTTTRERICQANLLELASLDDVLLHAEETFDLFHRRGNQGETVLLRESFHPQLLQLRALT